MARDVSNWSEVHWYYTLVSHEWYVVVVGSLGIVEHLDYLRYWSFWWHWTR